MYFSCRFLCFFCFFFCFVCVCRPFQRNPTRNSIVTPATSSCFILCRFRSVRLSGGWFFAFVRLLCFFLCGFVCFVCFYLKPVFFLRSYSSLFDLFLCLFFWGGGFWCGGSPVTAKEAGRVEEEERGSQSKAGKRSSCRSRYGCCCRGGG